MSYLQFITAFDLVLIGLIVLWIISMNVGDYLYRHKHINDKSMSKEEFERLRHDKSSIFYLSDDLR